MKPVLFAYPCSLVRATGKGFRLRFPDVPEAEAEGVDLDEALKSAADRLTAALATRLLRDRDAPTPSAVRRGQYQVIPAPTIAPKIALHKVTAEKGIRRSELARRLGVWHKEVRRMFDPRVPTKIGRLRQALATLGHDATIVVYDTTTEDRLIASPGQRPPKATGKTKR